jgi:hypothetical protein
MCDIKMSSNAEIRSDGMENETELKFIKIFGLEKFNELKDREPKRLHWSVKLTQEELDELSKTI